MFWCVTVRLKSQPSLTLLSLLVALVIAASVSNCVMGARDKLLVQNVEISPRVAKVGESVGIKANIKNAGKFTKKCCVRAYVGESVVEEFEGITIPPGDIVPLMFSVNTSSLNEGTNPVGMVIEEESNEQEIFDLGNIQVQPEKAEQVISGGFNMLYLLPIFPLGAVVSFFVWKKRSRKKQEDEMSKDLLPNLLNEVLNFEENVKAGAAKSKDSSVDTSYVR